MSIENIKDYWNNQPCNIKHSSLPLNTKEYFDEVEKKKYLVEPHIITFADFNKWKDKEILELERKISEILRLYCNKKISSNSLSLVYTNRPIIKYLNSLNSLENEKMRYYYLTLQNLKAQHELYTLILNKNYVLWNKINNT